MTSWGCSKTERAFWKFNCCIKGVGGRQKAFAGMEHKRIWTYQFTRQEKAQTAWWWQRAQAQRFKDWSCSDTGNMQLPYNSPGDYLVHVLFSQCVYFPINGPGRPSGKPRYMQDSHIVCKIVVEISIKQFTKFQNCLAFANSPQVKEQSISQSINLYFFAILISTKRLRGLANWLQGLHSANPKKE